MTRVVITGCAGMLGQDLLAAAPEGVVAVGVARRDGDLALPAGVAAAVEARRPDLVIHAAAWTDVDGCERDPARAWRSNAQATRLVAGVCRRLGARLVYLSTEYVFAGSDRQAIREGAPPCPLGTYGETKLAGEVAARRVPDHLIVRTQWLFGDGRRNFVSAILGLAAKGEPLSVVADQWGSPTYTAHLAPRIWRAALEGWGGFLHLAGRGVATWYDVAVAALEATGIGCPVTPVGLDEWPSLARRPRYAPLSLTRWEHLAREGAPSWRLGVAEYARRLAPPGPRASAGR